MSPVSIKATELPLNKVFSDDYLFRIPRYQRPYSWGREQAEALIDDLLFNVKEVTHPDSIPELPPYFLGSLVVIKGDTPQADVLDGQQRLTTLSILFSALRQHTPSDIASDINSFLYQKASTLLGTKAQYRLTLRDRDEKFFQDYIQIEGGILKLQQLDPSALTDSQRLIRDNALYYLDRISQLSVQERINLVTYMSLRCYVVIVSTPDFDSAYRIFSVLNDRGLDLSHSDVLKADVIGEIEPAEQDAYGRKWEDLEDELGRAQFEDLFAHIRMIYRKQKMRATVLKEIREFVLSKVQPKAFIDDILCPMAQVQRAIMTEKYTALAHADEVNRLLRYLRRLDNTDWLPPALSFLVRYRDSVHNRDSADKILSFVRDLERLAMGLAILHAGINERIERYGRVLTEIEQGADLKDPGSALQLTDSEKKRIIEVLDGNVYELTKVRLPILLRLDEALSGGGASYDYPVISVEHVLPQNPPADSEWTKWYPDAEQRARYVHRLGNLVLLSRRKNSQAQNYDFATKKKKYFSGNGGTSPFVLTTQVLQYDTWTPGDLEKRQKELLQKLKEIWRLE